MTSLRGLYAITDTPLLAGGTVPGRSVVVLMVIARWASREEVADAVVWLASPRAAFSTGSSLLVDGGWTAR